MSLTKSAVTGMKECGSRGNNLPSVTSNHHSILLGELGGSVNSWGWYLLWAASVVTLLWRNLWSLLRTEAEAEQGTSLCCHQDVFM